MGTFFPEAWRNFSEALPDSERSDLLANYYSRLTHPDPAIHMPVAAAWSRYETVCSNLIPRPEEPSAVFTADAAALALARIEAHYFVHDVFLEDGELLKKARRLRHIPSIIVQGRYDMVCPIVTADALAHSWPEAKYVIVADAGHSAMEPGIRAALVRATETMKARVG
jgi:proline iminopeptidase